jgi:hypothetical protein
MKLASLAFLTILLFAHGTGAPAELLGLPLSQFRDGPSAVFGYALFGLLLAIAAMMIVTLWRCRLYHHVSPFCLAGFLLLLVAATSSVNGFHLLCSFVLFGLLYAYYALLLYKKSPAWLWAHLAVPALLVLMTQAHSYGLWQKSFIVYYLLVANVHHHLLSRGLAPRHRTALGRHSAEGWFPRRRVVYALGSSRSWSRRSSRPAAGACANR